LISSFTAWYDHACNPTAATNIVEDRIVRWIDPVPPKDLSGVAIITLDCLLAAPMG
jgi:hypothetical protein